MRRRIDRSMAFKPKHSGTHQADYGAPAGGYGAPALVGANQLELYTLQSGIELLGVASGSGSGKQQHPSAADAVWTRGYGSTTYDPASSSYLASSSRGDPVGDTKHQYLSWHPPRRSKYLLPAQELLQELCSLPAAPDDVAGTCRKSKSAAQPPSSSTMLLSSMSAVELQRLNVRLHAMLEEVDRRYSHYRDQMRTLASSFVAAAGEPAAAEYTALAARTMSRHFRTLRDGVMRQIEAVRERLGEKGGAGSPSGLTRGDTPRLRVLDQCIRQQKALQQGGSLESHPWRPQRGLPERSVSVLRAWLFEHFLHPYPSDVDKHILARQTGLSRSQVSNWFINARVRLWKPMVEEMYLEELKSEEQEAARVAGHGALQVTPYHAFRRPEQTPNLGDHYDAMDRDQKPALPMMTSNIHLHLHDSGSGSLASVVRPDAPQGHGIPVGGFGADVDLISSYCQCNGDVPGIPASAGGGVSLTLGLQQHNAGGMDQLSSFAGTPQATVGAQGSYGLYRLAGDAAGVHGSGHRGEFDAPEAEVAACALPGHHWVADFS